MKNPVSAFVVLTALLLVMACNFKFGEQTETSPAPPAPSAPPAPGANGNSKPVAKKAYKISGTIDDASQEGNVCDTSVSFKVPGTLDFEFTPSSPTKGTYKYTGPFNANGEGPYEIKDDGTMIVDGTGCIMGKCATYSHKWKAEPIDPTTCN